MQTLQPNWPAPSCIKAHTTLRHSWGQRTSPDQEPGNRDALSSLLNLPNDPIWLTQKHTACAVEATPDNKNLIADASFTMQTQRICVVLTADCLPLLLCNKEGTHVAAIHAGWRGLANGVIETTVQALQQNPDDLLVWLGPAIGPRQFEVGADVYTAFTEKHAESKAAFIPHTKDKWLADLYALARHRLHLQGISHIYGGDFCTYTQADLFYSYRRDKGATGRMASLIWIADN